VGDEVAHKSRDRLKALTRPRRPRIDNVFAEKVAFGPIIVGRKAEPLEPSFEIGAWCCQAIVDVGHD